MAITVHDIGELGLGGIIAGAKWWDNKRLAAGTLDKTKVLKKASFWSYVIGGGGSVLISAVGWMPRQSKWFDNMTHFAIGYLPIFLLDTISNVQGTAIAGGGAAVAEAQRILAQRRQAALQLAAGRGAAGRVNYEVTNPQEILV
ncbi:MAG: hypothetical protein Q8R28_03095, partial [Dehalococcoidia bacterium]|nr:hypothetical protein [Dehalococcoidia bacterium]